MKTSGNVQCNLLHTDGRLYLDCLNSEFSDASESKKGWQIIEFNCKLKHLMEIKQRIF